MNSLSSISIALLLYSAPPLVEAQGHNASGNEHWVATWSTAEQLAPTTFGGRGGRGGPSSGQSSNGSAPNPSSVNAPAPQSDGRPPQAARSGRGGGANSNLPPTVADQTVRMIVHTSISGRRLRVELSNMAGGQPLDIGAAHIAVHKGGGAIADGTDRVLSFSGSTSFTVQPGVLVISDPVDLEVGPLSDLAISLYLPHETSTQTNHQLGLHTAYISKGDVTASASMPDPTTMFAYAWIAGVDVVAPADAFTVVALGDSITDGFKTTRDENQAWPTLLAKRLNTNKATQHVAVVNQGISGNQVLRDGAGVSALMRLDRDVLTIPGVKWVILIEGINDINIRGRADGPNALTSDELIWGYKQIIARCHEHGLKVIGATVMPEEGVPTASERGEAIRQKVNEWIRAKGNFDALVDFDAVVRDHEKPVRMKPEFDPGDHIHPNDSGNHAMAEAFGLGLFKKQEPAYCSTNA
jgi:lysophospholipase L1-like esterase